MNFIKLEKREEGFFEVERTEEGKFLKEIKLEEGE